MRRTVSQWRDLTEEENGSFGDVLFPPKKKKAFSDQSGDGEQSSVVDCDGVLIEQQEGRKRGVTYGETGNVMWN